MAEEPIAATPAAAPGGTPPAAAPATPAVPEATVTLTKEQHDQLVRDATRASTNQSKADRYDKIIGKGGHFKPSTPATPPTPEEQREHAADEDRKAERGLLALAADPALRAVLDADPTLRSLLTNNPLAVLPLYANDALDAEDAVSLVKEALMKRIPAAPATPPGTPPAAPATPPTPPAGGVNPPGDKALDEEYEAARKTPNTESAIHKMIGIGIKKMGGGK